MKNKICTQLLTTVGALMLVTQTGISDGWDSPNIARMTGNNGTIQITASEASWLVYNVKLGRLTSILLMPLLIELAGSRIGLIYSCIPIIVSWTLTMLASSVICLYVARFLSGMTAGLTFGLSSIYLAEISTPSLRGTFVSLSKLGWTLGILMATASDSHLQMDISAAWYLAECLLGILLVMWLPESPHELVKNDNTHEAKKSLRWYRGVVNTEAEMHEIVEFVESTGRQSLNEIMQHVRSKSVRKAVIVVSVLFAYLPLSGVFNVLFYVETILAKSESYLIDPKKAVIYANLILLVSTIVGANLIDRLGRRILLVISSFGMTIALIGLGLHYYPLINTKIDPKILKILPVSSIVLYVIAFGIGFSTVPITLLGEMFPAGVKSTAATIVTFVGTIFEVACSEARQPLINVFGESSMFWAHAAITISAIPIVMVFLPETKGKSLLAIQKDLNKRFQYRRGDSQRQNAHEPLVTFRMV